MSKELVISSNRHETKVGILEEDQLVEIYFQRANEYSLAGSIHKGRVTKVLPGMQSAFVDLGLDRDAFLYVSDVIDELDALSDPENGGENEAVAIEDVAPRVEASIADLLREGQEIVVQVTKDTIAGKGARITTHVTLPGRFLVYMPSVNHIGVSRRIENPEERDRMKSILESLRRNGGGLIARTAAEGKTADEITADMEYLRTLNEQIK